MEPTSGRAQEAAGYAQMLELCSQVQMNLLCRRCHEADSAKKALSESEPLIIQCPWILKALHHSKPSLLLRKAKQLGCLDERIAALYPDLAPRPTDPRKSGF